MVEKKMNTGMEAASKDGGQSEFGFLLTVDDFVKLAKDAGCKDSLKEGEGLADRAPINDQGQVTFENLFRFCKENGSIDEVPAGASFKAQAWADFQAWWNMRKIFMSADKDMSGTLSMVEVDHLHDQYPDLIKWAWSDMQTDSHGDVAFEEFQAWWNMRRKFDQIDGDKSEKLDKEEMIKMAELLRIPNFEVADMDLAAEGEISFEDFQAWWRMRMMFSKADVSGEDHLTRAEVQQLARNLGIQISVRSMDVDGDDCIDFSEFAVWWNMRHKFDLADTNGNGSLSLDEANKLGSTLGAVVNFADMDEDNDGTVDFKEFTEWYKMRRCFEKIDVSGDGALDHDEIKRLAYMLGMDLKIEDIDKDNDGEVNFEEFQRWWGGNKTRAQVMSRVAMQMDRDKANKVEQEPGPPAAMYIGAAAAFTAITVLPTVYSVWNQIQQIREDALAQQQ